MYPSFRSCSCSTIRLRTRCTGPTPGFSSVAPAKAVVAIVPKHPPLRESGARLVLSAGSQGDGLMPVDVCLRAMVLARNHDVISPFASRPLSRGSHLTLAERSLLPNVLGDLAGVAIPDDALTGLGWLSRTGVPLTRTCASWSLQSLAHVDYSDVLVDPSIAICS